MAALFRTAAMWQAVEGLVLLVRVSADENVPEPIRQQVELGIDAVVRAEHFALLGSLHAAETRVHGEAPRAAQYVAELDGPRALSLAQRICGSGRRSLYEFALVLLDHVAQVAPDSRTARSMINRIASGRRTESQKSMLMVLRAQILVLLERYTEALQLTTAVINALYQDVTVRGEHEIPSSTSVIRISSTDDAITVFESTADNSEALTWLCRCTLTRWKAMNATTRDSPRVSRRLPVPCQNSMRGRDQVVC